ncbi:transcription antitermination factor NusB [Zavarzinella formosa]|uniref:transcription antitermination factor NusB n=1 Tax=Zavarzinella formosa TaxID=360055 RepID=UPI000494DC41|nr:transcription antitermination factor NusB [Zavarzinella formosa]
MTRRSRAREVALQLLFQRDLNADVPRKAIEQFTRDRLGVRRDETGRIRPEEAAAYEFCLGLYDGVVEVLKTLDARISAASENWKLHRMAASDRNVLRLGAYELVHAKEPTPAAVALDEAIELARRYGSKDSPSFVNGVLDKVFRVYTEEKAKAAPSAPVAVAETVG